jgi:formimidoylglutamase
MSGFLEGLVSADPELFFSKGDPDDPRLGETVRRAVPRDAESLLEGAHVAILGVPEDRGIAANHGREGARFGPRAIRRAFYRLTPGFRPYLTELSLVDLGDVPVQGKSLEEVHDELANVVEAVVRAGVLPVVLGGSHDLTYPGLLGLTRGLGLKGGELGVVNLDSHLDVRDPARGLSSGTPFRRALEELPGGALRGENFVEFGVQEGHNSPVHERWLAERRATILTLKAVQGKPMESFLQALQIAGLGTRGIAVSVDIDGVQSTDAPGASARHADGLPGQDLDRIARLAGRAPRVRYFDVMEMSPPLDEGERTASACASALFWFLKGILER